MYKRRLVVKKTIPVVYASDDNFLKQTFVSIYSVLSNKLKRRDYDEHGEEDDEVRKKNS